MRRGRNRGDFGDERGVTVRRDGGWNEESGWERSVRWKGGLGKKGSDCVWRGYAVIGMKMR